MPGIAREDKERALAIAKVIVAEHRTAGAVAPGTPTAVSEWFADWTKVRAAKGKRTRDDVGRYRKWIEPRIGAKPMTAIVRGDLEELVQALDAAVLRGELAWKTAINVWAVASKMFKDAVHSKVLSLRILESNPAQGVEGPDHGTDRKGTYLYPREFTAVMVSRRVPTRWKRIFAIAAYLYCRGGELAALEWADVNLAQGFVSFHQSETEDEEIKATKTGRNRKTPIEPTLLPLLTEMHAAAKGEGRVITTMPPREEWAERLRKYVRWACEDAGIALRAEIEADDETRRPLNFHDLRHTGITWRAIRGDDLVKIQRAAGHTDAKTTQRYIEEAEVFDREAFGDVFPPLPAALAGADRIGRELVNWPALIAHSASFSEPKGRPQRESKTVGPRSETSRDDARSPEKQAAPAIEEVVKPETSRPDSPRPEPERAEPSDAEIEAAIVRAMLEGRGAVAEQLAAMLKARREGAAGNVVALPRRGTQ